MLVRTRPTVFEFIQFLNEAGAEYGFPSASPSGEEVDNRAGYWLLRHDPCEFLICYMEWVDEYERFGLSLFGGAVDGIDCGGCVPSQSID